MTKKTHIAVGVAATLPLLSFCPKYAAVGIVAAAIPDIDFLLKIKHRTLTHSVIALFIGTVLITSINVYIGVIFGFNYIIHLVLDSFTNMGVPLFYPFLKKCYGPRLILTGGWEDLFICIMAIFIIGILW